jgi:hypothetical protein
MAGSGTIKTQKKKKNALGVPCAACLYGERGHSGKHETHKDYQERAEMEERSFQNPTPSRGITMPFINAEVADNYRKHHVGYLSIPFFAQLNRIHHPNAPKCQHDAAWSRRNTQASQPARDAAPLHETAE